MILSFKNDHITNDTQGYFDIEFNMGIQLIEWIHTFPCPPIQNWLKSKSDDLFGLVSKTVWKLLVIEISFHWRGIQTDSSWKLHEVSYDEVNIPCERERERTHTQSSLDYFLTIFFDSLSLSLLLFCSIAFLVWFFLCNNRMESNESSDSAQPSAIQVTKSVFSFHHTHKILSVHFILYLLSSCMSHGNEVHCNKQSNGYTGRVTSQMSRK